ncbi:MAG: ABC transporter ATP-binding protein, partial [Bacillales bacterium]
MSGEQKQPRKALSAGMRGHGGMLVGLDKPKHFKRTLFRLLNYLKPRMIPIIFVFGTAIFGTVFSVFGPKVMGMVITVLFEGAYETIAGETGAGIDFRKVAQLLLLLGALYVTSSLFQFLQQFTMAKVAQETVYDLREDVFNKLNRLPIKYFDSRPYGETLS